MVCLCTDAGSVRLKAVQLNDWDRHADTLKKNTDRGLFAEANIKDRCSAQSH